jgi:thymidylate synthase
MQGLQEEIKFLEYELKLLKDKEILEREGVNELDNFLKDEIPINENILAMKNKYNATKAKLEQQLSNLNMKKGEAEDVLRSQKNEIERLHQIIDAHRRQKDDRRQEFKDKLAQ